MSEPILQAMEKLDQELSNTRAKLDSVLIAMTNLGDAHEKEIHKIREQRDRLAEAGQALVDRWETPFWKDVPHTGKFIRALADALAAVEGGSNE